MDLISSVSIFVDDEKYLERGRALAEKLRLPLSLGAPTATELCLYVDERLSLGFANDKHPYNVDFLSPEWLYRKRRGLGDNSLFLRALKIRAGSVVLDATAGFGQDAFLMAWAGAHVTAVEQNAVVFELLTDGLRRALSGDNVWPDLTITAQLANTQDFLRNHGSGDFEVVYIDAMFDKPKKSTKSPKPMQLLQTLLQSAGSDIDSLLELGMQKARDRVVVKMPLKAQPVSRPTASFNGKSIRFDIYS